MPNNQDLKAEYSPETYQKVREKVINLKDFYIHLASYCVIIPFLFFIDWLNSRSKGGFPINWAYWPALGWGIGLIFHALDVFVGSSWEEKMIEKELQKQSRKNLGQ